MPLYEYHCTGCGERLEVMQRLSDARLRTCPSCEGILEKLISAPALQFKGSGWYVTDYGRSAGRTQAEAKGEAQAPKSEGQAGKSEVSAPSTSTGASKPAVAASSPAATS